VIRLGILEKSTWSGIRGGEGFYALEQKRVPVPGGLEQTPHPDARGLEEPQDAVRRCNRHHGRSLKKLMDMAHGCWGREIVYGIVLGCTDVVWIWDLALDGDVSYWLRNAVPVDEFLVITSRISVLKKRDMVNAYHERDSQKGLPQYAAVHGRAARGE